MVSFFGLGKKKKEAQEGPVHSLYAQQWKREQSPFGPRTPQSNTSSTSLPARPSSSHSSRSPSPGGQKSIYANKSATGSMQDLSTSGSKRPGSGKLPRTGSPLRPTSSDGSPQPNLGSARPMSPGSLAAAASQAGFRFENSSQQRPLVAHPTRKSSSSSSSSSNENNSSSNQPRTPSVNSPAKRPSPGSIERNRSPLGRYEVRSEAEDSEVSSPMSQASRSQTSTTRSNVTSLTSIGSSSEMDRQIGQWAVRVSDSSSGIDEKVRSPTSPSFSLEEQQQQQQQQQQRAEKGAALDVEEDGLKKLDTISISEPRASLMPLSAHDPGTGTDGRGYSMILQYYLDSDARESMVI